MNRWAELVGAATLLTRLPVGSLTTRHPPPADAVWAYPVIGGLVGMAGAAVLAAGLALGLPQPLAAVWALAAITLISGGLHEDGLADTADGFGGGRTAERKLAIMRDSRIGSFGGLALIFVTLLRAAALATSPHPLQALVIGCVLGRTAMLLPLLLLRPARGEGLGQALAGVSRSALLAGALLALPAALWAPRAGLAAFAASLALTALAARQVRGVTGDILGATEQAAECAALTTLAA